MELGIVAGFALAAAVLTLSALAAGVVDRAPLSFPMLFLGLGFLIGPLGVGGFSLSPHSPLLQTIGILTLALVLFLDAINLEAEDFRENWKIPVLVLGPGTALVMGAIAAVGVALFGLDLVTALILGAILASTDPVVLRDVIRNARIPRPVRRALSVEAGTNDVVVLPTLLVLFAVATADSQETSWPIVLVEILLLGPVVGFIIAGAGAELMARADRRFGIREEYQALYGVGLVLLCYAAGEAVGGDGLLAAFSGGVAVAVLNADLCSCFLDFGRVVSEMLMLTAFLLFGVVLSEILGQAPVAGAIVLALASILIIRPAFITSILLPLSRHLSTPGRWFIAWFGPRGLNSLLFALLAISVGAAGTSLLAIVGVVVLFSVVLHGATATPLSRAYAGYIARQTTEEERAQSANDLVSEDQPDEAPRITVDQLAERLRRGEAVDVLDVRSRSAFERDRQTIPGAVRVIPDEVAEWAARRLHHHPVVLYCT